MSGGPLTPNSAIVESTSLGTLHRTAQQSLVRSNSLGHPVPPTHEAGQDTRASTPRASAGATGAERAPLSMRVQQEADLQQATELQQAAELQQFRVTWSLQVGLPTAWQP